MTGETDLDRLLAGLDPLRRPGEYVVVTSAAPLDVPVHATIREDEGITSVVLRADADAAAAPYEFVGAWITLQVHSSLDAVGLTAAVAAALAGASIACNVLAGYFHDHLLVPAEQAAEALAVLADLRDQTRRTGP